MLTRLRRKLVHIWEVLMKRMKRMKRMSQQYFHVDRAQSLQLGQVISLNRAKINNGASNAPDPALQAHFDKQFPAGVSRHGESYFLKAFWAVDATNNRHEIVFEYVRQAAFPQRPSRFTSFFVSKSLGDARAFGDKYRSHDANDNGLPYTIWEVEGEEVFTADMELISQHQANNFAVSYVAHQYWSGATIMPNPEWETFLKLPVRVVRLVERR